MPPPPSRLAGEDRRPLPLPPGQYLRVVVPLALSTTLDLGFSLWSLAYLSVSLCAPPELGSQATQAAA